MTRHQVTLTDLQTCKLRVDAKVAGITDELVAMNANVEGTHFIGENADSFAESMNAKVDLFVEAQRLNLANILETVTANMNVVVTKLGGEPWPAPEPIDLTNAQRAVSKKGEGYGIETTDMESLQLEIRKHMQQISNLYATIGSEAIAESAWEGPEKEATAEAVSGEVRAVVLPDIESTASELALALAKQVETMGSSAPSTVW